MRIKFFTEKSILYFTILVSILFNILLSFEVRNLRLSLYENEIGRKSSEIILGRTVSPLRAENLDGKEVLIDFKNSLPTVLYVFSPNCQWCKRNLSNINALSKQAGSKYQFLALSIDKDSSKSSVEKASLDFPVYINPSNAGRAEYGFMVTPATYVISSDSKVIKYWEGAYSGEVLRSINDYFQTEFSEINYANQE